MLSMHDKKKKKKKKKKRNPIADTKIRTSSPMTFNHFRYDVRKKKKRKHKIAIVVVFPYVF